MNDKILVLFTGGTIGSIRVYDTQARRNLIMQPSEAKERGLANDNVKSLLVEKFCERNSDFDESRLIVSPIMEQLSENMTLNIWSDLVRKLKTIDFNKYKGVIITHGTDTLGYFANFLAIVLDMVKVPVMVVSSNFELENSRANGINNFASAIKFIDNVMLPGVYVPYTSNHICKIHHGSRVTQCKSVDDDFASITQHSTPLGIIDRCGNFKIEDYALYNSICSKILSSTSYIDVISRINSDILIVNPYVGLNYNMFNINNCDAIIHTLYHSGTACNSPVQKNSIYNFAKQCKMQNKDFYIGPMYGKESRDLYSSAKDFINYNILMNTSVEAAYAKLLVAYECFGKDKKIINEFLTEKISEEFIGPSKLLKK